MSVVTYFVETSEGYLNSAAETQFGSVAATVGTLIVLAATLIVAFVFINMVFQVRSMDGRTAFWLAVKITLVGLFATNWIQFNAFSSGILSGIDSIAGALVASVGGGALGPVASTHSHSKSSRISSSGIGPFGPRPTRHKS